MALDSVTYHANVTLNSTSDDLNSKLRILLTVITCFLSGSIALFGISTNVLNLIVFYRQGLNTTININLFALAACDLASLMCQEVLAIFAAPLFRETGLPVVYEDIQFMFLAIPIEGFAMNACFITALITTERYLCIVFPQSDHQKITPLCVVFILVCIALGNATSGMPIYLSCRLGWMSYPASNKTIFGIVATSHNKIQEKINGIVHAVIMISAVASVVISTSVLVVKLKQADAWRNSTNVNQKCSLSKRDANVVSMVVLIACITMTCGFAEYYIVL